jgi:hypothetical protein
VQYRSAGACCRIAVQFKGSRFAECVYGWRGLNNVWVCVYVNVSFIHVRYVNLSPWKLHCR